MPVILNSEQTYVFLILIIVKVSTMCQIYLITSKSRWHTITAMSVNGLQVDLNAPAAQTFPLEKY